MNCESTAIWKLRKLIKGGILASEVPVIIRGLVNTMSVLDMI